MIKEFQKISEFAEVQIYFKRHPEGIKAKIVFIPIKEGKALIPIEAWGTPEEVENSIRFNLDKLNPTNIEKKIGVKDYIDWRKTPIKTEEKEQGCPFDEPNTSNPDLKDNQPTGLLSEKEEEVKVVKKEEPMTTLFDIEEKDAENAAIPSTASSIIPPEIIEERCPKCDLPIKDDHSDCIYDDCPQKEEEEEEEFIDQGCCSVNNNEFPEAYLDAEESEPEWIANKKEEWNLKSNKLI